MSPSNKASAHGFSLIEVTIVCAIIFTLVTLSAMYYSEWRARGAEAAAVSRLTNLRSMAAIGTTSTTSPQDLADRFRSELACEGNPCVLGKYEYSIVETGPTPMIIARPLPEILTARQICLFADGQISVSAQAGSDCSDQGYAASGNGEAGKKNPSPTGTL